MAQKKLRSLVLLTLLASFQLYAQRPEKLNASEIYHNLQKLNFVGSALYVAAHPDDENTRLISYLSNDVKARTAYLSLTRGDGGQNLVGPEIRELLGVIRTQELLQARATDGGTQLFTRANDFGYSKHPDETLAIWNRKEVTSDVVRAIRKWKPDIIINRFNHRNPGTTHGHHTASAMLSFETFDVVGDASQYPESAEMYGAWQPKRLLFNTSWWFYGSREKFAEADKTNLLEVETGSYYADLGLSNGEIASLSRSMHKSQGFGSTGRRGGQIEYLEFLKGDFPKDKTNVFDGIDTSWSRLEGGKAIGDILYQVEKDFDFRNPAASVPQLMEAHELIKNLKDTHWRDIKTAEIKALIEQCLGLYLEAVADQQTVAPKGNVKVTVEAINRSNVPVSLNSVSSSVISFPSQLVATPLTNNKGETMESVEGTFNVVETSAPYWLQQQGTLGMYRVDEKELIGTPEQDSNFPVTFNLTIAGKQLQITKNIIYKFNDPVKGEVYRPFEVLPPVTSSIPEKVLIFSSEDTREIPVELKAGRENISGTVTLQHPKGWIVEPASQGYSLGNKGATQTLIFKVTPPKDRSEGYIKPLVQIGDTFHTKELITIDYDHIPYQSVLIPSQAKVARIPIEKRGENIGYIKGAGDAIPESLEQIGYKVTTVDPATISEESLAGFDAVVVGIRAYNTVPELEFKQDIIHNYVANGGTLLIQYNTSRRLVTDKLAPFHLKLSRDRVTDEYSEVSILEPKHPAFNTPNNITELDFEGWVQERGLYFPNEWGDEFTPLLGMNDEGYPETKGALLVAKHGKGHYIYTGLSFFRELPAGVSGAYRLFANLLSLGQ
ncbi:PIG-L family deacetylase [Aureisphaera galaxeae]|uniref:PIG-L family deacetylase n=1 Tax=Aureisphaera galaxeae TaxID=1538023 RepID=UPI00235005C2|nr:PIG-L family deacetylase [Aureisphaera galaxeae]MDC8003809.1 PIG-L family deacetylase [Aureisphaera galaxeae]